MRVAILSDIHANIEALEAVLADARAYSAEHYLCLGDTIGFNGDPAACVSLAMQLFDAGVRGNHEQALLQRGLFGVPLFTTMMDRTTAIYEDAIVGGYRLLAMGAIVSNGVETIDIAAVYLCGLTDTTVSFAVRIVNIPTDQYDCVITATPYIVLEIDGVATIVYGDAQICTYNAVKG